MSTLENRLIMKIFGMWGLHKCFPLIQQVCFNVLKTGKNIRCMWWKGDTNSLGSAFSFCLENLMVGCQSGLSWNARFTSKRIFFGVTCGCASIIQFGTKQNLCNFPERESIFLQSSFLLCMIQYNDYNDSCFHWDGSCNISQKELVTVDTQHDFKNLDCQTRMLNYHIFSLFICEVCVQFFNSHNEIWAKTRP